ncbi:hypothetical protein SUGI_1084940 [Cryptomeria japonica]|nr:hypothetical protein SUGI_1084940 [Cryptomeria japonica]
MGEAIVEECERQSRSEFGNSGGRGKAEFFFFQAIPEAAIVEECERQSRGGERGMGKAEFFFFQVSRSRISSSQIPTVHVHGGYVRDQVPRSRISSSQIPTVRVHGGDVWD